MKIRGLGTLINVIAIILGGIIGTIFSNHLKENIKDTLMSINGISVIVLGLAGSLSKMFIIENNNLNVVKTLMMIVSLSLGAIIGESLRLDLSIEKLAKYLKVKSHNEKDDKFINAFVNASCTVCIGAMAIIGSLEDGINGNYSILVAKALLDLVIIIIMSSSLGKGCTYSAFPVLLFQGFFTLTGYFIGNFLSNEALNNLSLVGNVLIICVGLNLIRDKQIKVINLLPSLIIAIIFAYF